MLYPLKIRLQKVALLKVWTGRESNPYLHLDREPCSHYATHTGAHFSRSGRGYNEFE